MKSAILLCAAGAVGGVIVLGQVDVTAFSGTGASKPPPTGAAAGTFEETGQVGPDVIVGALPSTYFWASDATETAYSIATTSCNIGDTDLDWIDSPSALHPVIGQNLFRLSSDGSKFEQVGQSWLKHAFCALQLDLAGCGSCSNPPGCLDHLVPGCSDPYSAQRNGTQSGLGPKWQVNANTGVFPVPWHQGEGTSGSYRRRLRVQNTDLSQSSNPQVKWFIEGQYVTRDDATWGNQNNNASYRQVNINASSFAMSVTGSTFQQHAGINAWKAQVPAVTIVDVEIPDEGLFKVAYLVVQRSPTQWSYDYAIYNMNSDRAGGAFTVPVPDGVTVNAIGFHDVPYHSGDGINGVNYSGADWVGVRGSTDVAWETESYASNQNANALRWGTLYNYRFNANTPPVAGTATLGLFKPGTPTEMTVDVLVPSAAPECQIDLDGDGEIGFNDLLAVLAAWGPCGGCPEDFDADGEVGFADLLATLAAWGPCP
jgi:hypothetical protein